MNVRWFWWFRTLTIQVITFFVVLFLIFSLVYMAGGTTILPVDRTPGRAKPVARPHKPQARELPGAYLRWLGNAFQLDFGRSLVSRQPVNKLIFDRLKNSILLNIYAFTLMLGAGITIGIIIAFRSRHDTHPVEWFLYVLYAIPDFVLGILLLSIFSFELGWFPSHGLQGLDPAASSGVSFWRTVYFMTLPAFTLAASGVVFLARFTKTSVMELMDAPFVFAMRSRGLSSRLILYRVFRNSLIPFMTLSGFLIPALVGGSVVVESLFSFPGIGKTFYDAVLIRDYPIILAITMIDTAFVYIGLALSAIFVRIADPRTRYEVAR